MYDRIRLFVPRTSSTTDPIPYLERVVESIDKQTGVVSFTGNVGGMSVCVYATGISIAGSLAKYMYGNNICSLSRRTTAEALATLSDALHLDVTVARVTGLEFGTNFIMRKPVGVYMNKLGEVSRMVRSNIKDDTLYYKSKGQRQMKVLCFYDKIADIKGKHMALPVGLECANLLRYEMRLQGRLCQQLHTEVSATTLSDRTFYAYLVQLWEKYYFSISKIIAPTIDMTKIKSVSDAYNAFIALLISQITPQQAAAFMDELKAANVFHDRKYYTRLRHKFNNVAQGTVLATDCDVQELDDAVRNAASYW